MTINRRLNRIFRSDGRAVIVALDHGLIDGPCPGFESPADTIAAVVSGGADAILTSYGIARRFAVELADVGDPSKTPLPVDIRMFSILSPPKSCVNQRCDSFVTSRNCGTTTS